MSRLIYDTLTLKQFLRLPEAKPAFEYIDGLVIQRTACGLRRGVILTALGSALHHFLRPRGLGSPYLRLRCTFGGRSIVPDIAYIARGRIPRDENGELVDDICIPPDLMIVDLDPRESSRRLGRLFRRCLADGVRLAWLIQLSRRRVDVFRPGEPVAVLGPGDVLDGGDALPGFEPPIDELFGWLLID
jgi:Uma2 family endonuclease